MIECPPPSEKYPTNFHLIFVLIIGLTGSVLAFDGTRFGLTGGSNAAQNTFVNDFHLGGLSYEGNYEAGVLTPASLRPSSDPTLVQPVGSARMVLREIGKLGNRTDGFYPIGGDVQRVMTEWLQRHIGYIAHETENICLTGTPLCYPIHYDVPVPGLWLLMHGATFPPDWYNPNDESLLQIFQEEAPLIQAKMLDLNTQTPADHRTIWAMGNEPNLIEQITPEQYASMYTNYWRFIKGIDPGAKVAFGEVFLTEFFEQHEESITILSRKVVDAKKDAFLSKETTPWIYSYIASTEVGSLVEQIGLDFVVGKVNEALTHRLWDVNGEEYLRRALEALPSDVVPDYISFHVYPFDLAPHAAWSHWQTKLQSFLDNTQTRYQAKYGVPARFLITEFGNINPDLNATPSLIADQMDSMVTYLESRSDVDGWWWFEPVGEDVNLKSILPEAPMSRLYQNSDVYTIPQNYTCSDLTDIGSRIVSMYWPSFCNPSSQANPGAPRLISSSFWNSTTPISLAASPTSNGAPSILSTGPGYRILTSSQLGGADRALVTSRLAVDVYLPAVLPNPWWKGNLQLSANSPSTNLWNSSLGQVDFSTFDAGNFSTAIFPLSVSQQASLRNAGDDLQLSLAVNAPSDVYLDNVRFLPEGAVLPSFPSTRFTERTLAAQSTEDWSTTVGFISTVMENGTTHLGDSSSGYGVVTSGWLNRDDLAAAPSQVKFQFRIPFPNVIPDWPGEIGVFVNAPTRGIYHAWVGSQSLQGIPYGQWNNLTFGFPADIAQSLAGTGSEFQVQLVLNFPQSGLNFEWKNMELTP